MNKPFGYHPDCNCSECSAYTAYLKAPAAFSDANPKDALGAKKPPVGLVPWSALVYAARVMELGATKYGPYNWRERKVNRTVYIDAAIRHLMAARDGENEDAESSQPHEAHALACMAILLDAMATGNLIDDRPKPGAAGKLIALLTKK